MNVLLLPDLHAGDSIPLESDAMSVVSLPPAPKPTLSIPGFRRLPSPLHFQLRVITRLQFNEHGRITRHRDFWDTRDLFGLLPGAKLVQWAGTRVVARGLSAAAWILGRRRHTSEEDIEAERGELEHVSGPVSLSVASSPLKEKAALGQHYEDRSSGSSLNAAGLRSLFVAPQR